MREKVVTYFRDAIDGGNPEVLRDLFTHDCVIHRPEMEIRGIEPFVKFVERIPATFSRFETTILDIFGAEDRLAVRLKHDVVVRDAIRSRLGTFKVSEREMRWDAIAIFRFEEGKIAEEWVSRDELGMLLSAGVISEEQR